MNKKQKEYVIFLVKCDMSAIENQVELAEQTEPLFTKREFIKLRKEAIDNYKMCKSILIELGEKEN